MLQTPGATSYMGCIGKDKFGEEMKKNAQAAGINVSCKFHSCFILLHIRHCHLCNQAHYYEDENAPTGTCAVCVVGGEQGRAGKI